MKDEKSKMLSILVPVFNESESLKELTEQLLETCADFTPFEIIFVDDGSTDDSLTVIKRLQERDSHIRYISLLRNYGKSAAYMAGFQYATGDTVVTLDADLQDLPQEIPKLLKAIDEGADLVVGWKQGRFANEPVKAIPSRFYNLLKSILFGLKIHDSNCGLKAMRSSVTDFLNLHGDQYRFIPELADSNGFHVTEVPVVHHQRKYGESKYGIGRFFTGIMDVFAVRFLTAFNTKPLHFFGIIAMIMFTLGGGLECYVLVMKLTGSTFRIHMASLVIGVMLILIGCQLFATGLIGELLTNINRKKHYTIKEKDISHE